MSYFFRHQLAKRFWREEDHPRGKTKEGTNAGSFAPADEAAVQAVDAKRNAGGRKLNSGAQVELMDVQRLMYRRLANGRYSRPEPFKRDVHAQVREALGAGYEREAEHMAERLWEHYRREPQTYLEPETHLREGWAVKTDVLI